jgi:hypothetical protein
VGRREKEKHMQAGEGRDRTMRSDEGKYEGEGGREALHCMKRRERGKGPVGGP